MELRYWKGSHFLGCSNYPDCRHTVNLPANLSVHYENGRVMVKEALESATEAAAVTIPCETCGGVMEMLNGRFGRYFRCTNDECKATAPVSTGVECPSCGEGTLIEKYSGKRRRTFYSCNRYPKCRYAVSDLPVKVCPSCHSAVMTEHSGELRCTNKDCGAHGIAVRCGRIDRRRVGPDGRYAASLSSLNHSRRCLRSESWSLARASF